MSSGTFQVEWSYFNHDQTLTVVATIQVYRLKIRDFFDTTKSSRQTAGEVRNNGEKSLTMSQF